LGGLIEKRKKKADAEARTKPKKARLTKSLLARREGAAFAKPTNGGKRKGSQEGESALDL